jgi:hypothetical protein
VDRGALEVARELGIPHGGWCPRGRLAEDGPIPAHYRLVETDSPRYAVRTKQNVLDSAGTLILCRGPLQGGTELTYRLARHYRKPCLVIDLQAAPDPLSVRHWLAAHHIDVLNVAGPRESSCPGIARQAGTFLRRVLCDDPASCPPTRDASF